MRTLILSSKLIRQELVGLIIIVTRPLKVWFQWGPQNVVIQVIITVAGGLARCNNAKSYPKLFLMLAWVNGSAGSSLQG